MSWASLVPLAILLGMILTPFSLLPQGAHAAGEFKAGFEKVKEIRSDAGIKEYASLLDFILAVLGVIGSLIAVAALVALTYGAILYITSLGDETKTAKAKQVILYAIIGLIILGAAGIIVNVAINLIKK